jgi:hypothetical protein
MKKIMVLAVGVLFSTLVFANGTDEPSSSSFKVTNSGSDLFKVFYKASKSNDVKISIINEKERVVFSETVKKTDGFMRPYNFENLPEGRYIIDIQDENGEHVQKVNYGALKVEKQVNISRVQSEKDKYLLSGISQGADKIIVRIYDADGKIAYEETHDVDGAFARLYNLKDIKGIFMIEVSDNTKILKTFRN